MNALNFLNCDSRRRTEAFSLVLVCLLISPSISLADDLPSLRPGLWEFKSSMEDNTGMYRQTTFTKQKCADPVSDIMKMNEKFSRQGCSLSSPSRHGDSYESTSVCQVLGIQMESRTTLTALGDSAYKVSVISHGKNGSTTEELTATRLGDCRKRSHLLPFVN